MLVAHPRLVNLGTMLHLFYLFYLCRVKTDISAVLTVKSGLDPHMIIELDDDLNRYSLLMLLILIFIIYLRVDIYLHLANAC
jgi:hypothetical protein